MAGLNVNVISRADRGDLGACSHSIEHELKNAFPDGSFQVTGASFAVLELVHLVAVYRLTGCPLQVGKISFLSPRNQIGLVTWEQKSSKNHSLA